MTGELAIPSQGLQLLSELEKAGAITTTSLTLPPDVPFDRYEALMTMFGQLHRMNAWLIGDGINYGEKVYGETYAQAIIWTGLAEQTLTNYASVCGRVPKSRRRQDLPFSVHAELASLEPQQQKEWLKRAAEGQWTRSILRDHLAPMRIGRRLPDPEAAELASAGEITGGNTGNSARVSADLVLPPEVGSHICHCVTCGRSHRDDVDVTE